MKIARYRARGRQRWGLVDLAEGTVQPIDGPLSRWARAVMAGRPAPLAGDAVALTSVELVAPVTPSTKIVGVGANYLVHLERLGHADRPATPMAYFKPVSAIVGPDEAIAYPALTNELDYEVELVAVVGGPRLRGRQLGTREVLGYTVGNDVSARDAQSSIGGLDLFTMKALDRSTPVGPWIATIDEFGGPGQPDVELRLRVNGEERQRDRTSNMLFGLDEVLAYVDARTSLAPGDLVFTGTTSGVGAEDGRYLEPDDVIEAEIERIGVLRNTVGPRQPVEQI